MSHPSQHLFRVQHLTIQIRNFSLGKIPLQLSIFKTRETTYLPLTPATLRTPDLAEVASGAARAALGLGLCAHVVLAELSGGSTTFIGNPRLHVNEVLLDEWNPEGEE